MPSQIAAAASQRRYVHVKLYCNVGGHAAEQLSTSCMVVVDRKLLLHGHMQVQTDMVKSEWSNDVLSLPNCGRVVEQENLIWNGPKIRMGMYEGEPTRVIPHTTSGRADYFGPFVNRY